MTNHMCIVERAMWTSPVRALKSLRDRREPIVGELAHSTRDREGINTVLIPGFKPSSIFSGNHC